MLCIACLPARVQAGSLEAAVEATYLYKFAPFVEWPSGAFPSPSSPLDLCVVGDDPFAALADQAASGQLIGQHAVVLRRLPVAVANSGCQIMFIAGSEAQSAADAIELVRGTPVLTITDAARDGGVKGIINFVIRDNHVRFEIDDRAAAENGLEISSKLLSLAVHVRPRALQN